MITGLLYAEEIKEPYVDLTYHTTTGDFDEYIERYPYGALDLQYSTGYNVTGSSKKVFIIADDSYYLNDNIGWRIDRYAKDVSYQGYSTEVWIHYSASPNTLRKWLQDRQNGLEGVVFVGDTAVAWFECDNSLNTGVYVDWPVDIFYADLDGIYMDTDENRKYDAYTGNTDLEIFVSRFSSSEVANWGQSDPNFNWESQMIMYLDNTHAYYRGNYNLSHKAANMIDKDWSGSQVLRNRLNKSHIIDLYINSDFTLANFFYILQSGIYDVFILDAHSGPVSHDIENVYYYSNQIFDNLNVTPYHFVLGACKALRFTNYNLAIGLSYLFARNTNGLSAFGMTRTSNNRYDEYYCDLLSKGYPTGPAWRKWYNYARDKIYAFPHSYDDYYWSWHGGAIHYGDPFVNVTHKPNISPNSAPQMRGQKSYSLIEGNSYTLELDIFDMDNDNLDIVIQNMPTGAVFDGSNINWTPDYTQGGRSYTIQINVSDGYTSTTDTIEVDVTNYKKG